VQIADRVIELAPHELPTSERPPETLEVEPGTLIFEQGSYGDLIYVVEAGEVELFRLRADRTEQRIRVVPVGGYFGELGTMLSLPRNASARALTRATLTAYTVLAFRNRPNRATSVLESTA
jgi:putative ABC transport system ATP-binding protein